MPAWHFSSTRDSPHFAKSPQTLDHPMRDHCCGLAGSKYLVLKQNSCSIKWETVALNVGNLAGTSANSMTAISLEESFSPAAVLVYMWPINALMPTRRPPMRHIVTTGALTLSKIIRGAGVPAVPEELIGTSAGRQIV
jgi:hypothetical protein